MLPSASPQHPIVTCTSCGQPTDLSRSPLLVTIPNELAREPEPRWWEPWRTELMIAVPILAFGLVLWLDGFSLVFLTLVLVYVVGAWIWRGLSS